MNPPNGNDASEQSEHSVHSVCVDNTIPPEPVTLPPYPTPQNLFDIGWPPLQPLESIPETQLVAEPEKPKETVNLDPCLLCYDDHPWRECPNTYTPCPMCGWIGTHRSDCVQSQLDGSQFCVYCGSTHAFSEKCIYPPVYEADTVEKTSVDNIYWTKQEEEVPCKKCGDTPAYMHGMCEFCDYMERSANNYPPYEMFADGMDILCSECGINPVRIRGYCSECDPPGYPPGFAP